jgi:hypothetical protein
MKISAAVLFLAVSWIASAHDFTMCKSLPHDELGVESVIFTPDPPRSGKEVTVAVTGHTSAHITGGELVMDVRLLGISVVKQKFQVCDILACPLKPGDEYKGSVSQLIPEGTPRHMGATVRLTLTNVEGKALSCLESYVEVTADGEDESVEGILGRTKFDLRAAAEFLFEHWKAQHPKAAHNLEVFVENLDMIVKHNAQQDKSFTMAMNEFGSMTREEFAASRLGLREPNPDEPRNGPMKPRITLRHNPALADPPAELDWTTKGVVTPVKNQGSCGSCWAFSAVGSLESAYAIKTGNLIRFSEQELVSCDTGDYGCQGGLMDSAFDWIE